MSRRIDPSWVVRASIGNPGSDRGVDVFCRPDGSFGFEAFRRDPEDAGAFPSRAEAEAAARRAVRWFAEVAAGHH